MRKGEISGICDRGAAKGDASRYATSRCIARAPYRPSMKERKLSIRLKLEDSSEGLVATLSERNDAGKITGSPSTFRVGTKEEAKQRAKALARTLGLTTYGIVDKTATGSFPKS
jgi:hypothetical protein